jgi:copper homeostasis protein (lipoprotein)
MNRKLLVAMFVVMSAAVVACKREAPVEPETAAPQATAQAVVAPPAPVVDMARAGVQPDAAGFSSKAFAGTFKGKLPCADCPAIDETLELEPDGSFALTDVYQDRPEGTHTVAGSWTTEGDDTRIRLDPNTKAEEDRLYAIASHDEITPLGADGKPAASAPGHSLRRADAKAD